jgi:hypothetical protein
MMQEELYSNLRRTLKPLSYAIFAASSFVAAKMNAFFPKKSTEV